MHKKLWLIDINSNIGITEKSLIEIFEESKPNYTSFDAFFSVELNKNLATIHTRMFNHKINYNYSQMSDDCGDIFNKYRPLNMQYRKFDEMLEQLDKTKNEFIVVVRVNQVDREDYKQLTQLINTTLEKYNPKYFMIYGVDDFDLNNVKIPKLSDKTSKKIIENTPFTNLELSSMMLKSFKIYKLNLDCGNFNSPQHKMFKFYLGLNKSHIKDKSEYEYFTEKLLKLTKIKNGIKFTKPSVTINSFENQFLTSLNKIWDKISHLKNINLKMLDKSYLKLITVREMSLDELLVYQVYEKDPQFFNKWFIDEKIYQYPEKFRTIKNKISNLYQKDFKLTNCFVKFKKLVEITHKLGWFTEIKNTPFSYSDNWSKINFDDIVNIRGFSDWKLTPDKLKKYEHPIQNEFYELIPKNLLKSVIKTLIK